jgi:hypothetical protein
MKKKRWMLYVIFGLVFYLLFLIIETPASWFAWGLNRYTQGSVRLDPLAGSLWSGSGRLVIYYPKTTPHDFGQAEWSINPLWLLTGRIQLSVQTSHQDRQIKTTMAITRNSLMLKDTQAVFPAAFVAQIYTPLSLISPQGKAKLSTEGLTLSPDKMEGAAALEWQNAGSSLSNVQPLGDYRLDITGAGKNANLKLTTLRGALDLAGEGEWQLTSGQIQLKGRATPRERAGELEPLLKLLGNPQEGPGPRSLAFTGQIALPGSRP